MWHVIKINNLSRDEIERRQLNTCSHALKIKSILLVPCHMTPPIASSRNTFSLYSRAAIQESMGMTHTSETVTSVLHPSSTHWRHPFRQYATLLTHLNRALNFMRDFDAVPLHNTLWHCTVSLLRLLVLLLPLLLLGCRLSRRLSTHFCSWRSWRHFF